MGTPSHAKHSEKLLANTMQQASSTLAIHIKYGKAAPLQLSIPYHTTLGHLKRLVQQHFGLAHVTLTGHSSGLTIGKSSDDTASFEQLMLQPMAQPTQSNPKSPKTTLSVTSLKLLAIGTPQTEAATYQQQEQQALDHALEQRDIEMDLDHEDSYYYKIHKQLQQMVDTARNYVKSIRRNCMGTSHANAHFKRKYDNWNLHATLLQDDCSVMDIRHAMQGIEMDFNCYHQGALKHCIAMDNLVLFRYLHEEKHVPLDLRLSNSPDRHRLQTHAWSYLSKHQIEYKTLLGQHFYVAYSVLFLIVAFGRLSFLHHVLQLDRGPQYNTSARTTKAEGVTHSKPNLALVSPYDSIPALLPDLLVIACQFHQKRMLYELLQLAKTLGIVVPLDKVMLGMLFVTRCGNVDLLQFLSRHALTEAQAASQAAQVAQAQTVSSTVETKDMDEGQDHEGQEHEGQDHAPPQGHDDNGMDDGDYDDDDVRYFRDRLAAEEESLLPNAHFRLNKQIWWQDNNATTSSESSASSESSSTSPDPEQDPSRRLLKRMERCAWKFDRARMGGAQGAAPCQANPILSPLDRCLLCAMENDTPQAMQCCLELGADLAAQSAFPMGYLSYTMGRLRTDDQARAFFTAIQRWIETHYDVDEQAKLWHAHDPDTHTNATLFAIHGIQDSDKSRMVKYMGSSGWQSQTMPSLLFLQHLLSIPVPLDAETFQALDEPLQTLLKRTQYYLEQAEQEALYHTQLLSLTGPI